MLDIKLTVTQDEHTISRSYRVADADEIATSDWTDMVQRLADDLRDFINDQK